MLVVEEPLRDFDRGLLGLLGVAKTPSLETAAKVVAELCLDASPVGFVEDSARQDPRGAAKASALQREQNRDHPGRPHRPPLLDHVFPERRRAVDVHPSVRYRPDDTNPIARDLEDAAVADQRRLADALFVRELEMAKPVMVCPVDRDEGLGSNDLNHRALLFAAPVAARVHLRIALPRNHVEPATLEPIDEVEHAELVSGNDSRRENHRVPCIEMHLGVLVAREAGERRRGLALRASRQDRDLAAGQRIDLLGCDEKTVDRWNQPERGRDLGMLAHRHAEKAHLPSERSRDLERRSQSKDVGGKRGHDDSMRRTLHRLPKPRRGVSLELGPPLDLGPGRVAQQQAHAFARRFFETVSIEALPLARTLLDLEVSRVNDRTGRRIQDEPGGVRNRMMHREPLDADRPNLVVAPSRAHAEIDVFEPVLAQAVFDERGSVGRRVDGNAQVFEQIGQGSDVVFVSVGDHDRFEVVALRVKPAEIRVHELGTMFIGEPDPAIDRDRRAAAAQRSAVHADLVEAAKRDEANTIGHRSLGLGLKARVRAVKAAIAPLTRAIPACYAPDRSGVMRRFVAIIGVVCLSASAVGAQQLGPRRAAETEEEEAIEESEQALPEPVNEDDLPPQLRAPSLEGLEMPTAPDDADDEDFDESAFDDEDDMVADDTALLGRAEPPASDPTLATWTNPRPVFSLSGYFRVRGEYFDNFALGRVAVPRLDGDPFALWIQFDNAPSNTENAVLPAGGCKGEASATPDTTTQRCDGSATTRFANMRLRLQPTLSLGDNVRVHMMVDAFDNLVLGSTPEVRSVNQFGEIEGRAPGVPVDTLTRTSPPPESFRNTVGDALLVRRVWGEVTNSTIGQLRFGRMGHQWGLGMLWNAGEGTNPLGLELDSDFQSEIDRIQLIGKFKGIFFGVSWDFASKGYIFDPIGDIQWIPRDASRLDDTRQWSFLVARRLDPLAREKRLAAGKWVINGGAYFIYRSQFLSTSTVPVVASLAAVEAGFVRRDAKVYIPDGWLQVLWKDLRLEVEFAGIFGKIQNITPGEFPTTSEGSKFKLRQWGIAFEGEYRTLKKKMGIFLKTGAASGDRDVVGLSQYEDLATQPVGQKVVSTFSFHPDYRIDLILWRNILGRIAGAWYLAPAISYDILRSEFGRVLGARLDFIYSRAIFEQQTYSSEPNLGAEIDVSIYYRTESGPSFTDGFFAAFQFGVLFPLNGLRYLEVEGVREPLPTDVSGLRRAIALRLLLGISF